MAGAKRVSSTIVINFLRRVTMVLAFTVVCMVIDGAVAHSRSADYLLSDVRKLLDTSIVSYTQSEVSVIHCTYICSERNSKSLYFLENTKTCHCNHGIDNSTEVHIFGLITYGVLKTIGQPCSSDTDCTGASSGCHGSICRCDLTLPRYNPGNNSCVTTCERYGVTFHGYTNYMLVFANHVLTNVSQNACLEACLHSQQFCYGADIGGTSKKCYLSISGNIQMDPSQSFDSFLKNCV